VRRKGIGRKKRKVIGGIYFVPTITNYALGAIVSWVVSMWHVIS
jgi:hypothetical protein